MVGARSLVNHTWWIPKGIHLNGRVIEMTSILGPLFHVSALPDRTIFKSQPDVGTLTPLHACLEEITKWINKDNLGSTDGSRQHSDGENLLLQSQEATSSSSIASEPSPLNVKPTSSGGGKSKFMFICECFFMTARVLNLGLLKAFSDFKHLVQDISRAEDALATLKAMQGQTPSSQLELDTSQLEEEIETYSQESFVMRLRY